jgi:hypothetical protein
MAKMGKYLYCIIPCSENRTFDVNVIGNGGGVVHTVPHNGLATVVSESPVTQYESTRQNMVAHEKVLETVMKEFTLLPVRFGTVADSTSTVQDIQKLLRSRFEEFEKLLRDMEGKVELGLKAFWRDEKTIFEEIVAENTDIRRLRDSLSGKPPEATHFDRIRLGEMVKEALNRKRLKEAAKILLSLRQLAHRVRENETMGDRMVVNAAFLVDMSKEPEFDQAVNEMEERFGKRTGFKYIGPVPPYNFVNIVVNWEELG